MNQKHHFLLTLKDREKIESSLSKGLSHTKIAEYVNTHTSTVSREIVRGTDSQGTYRATYAHKKATSRIRSRKLGKRKILQSILLQQEVHTGLKEKWSPFQIAKKLRETYTDKAMNVSHESIYQYVYVLPRGSRKKTLTEGLRRSHKYRHTQRKQE